MVEVDEHDLVAQARAGADLDALVGGDDAALAQARAGADGDRGAGADVEAAAVADAAAVAQRRRRRRARGRSARRGPAAGGPLTVRRPRARRRARARRSIAAQRSAGRAYPRCRHGRAERARELQRHRRDRGGDRARRGRALRRTGRRCWPSPLATVALAGLAHIVSLATEQVGERFGPAATGVLQSTLGNLPELFVVIFALRAGEVVVAQTSIIGSLFANALLVLGLVIVFGARQAPDGVDALPPAAAQRHRDAAAGHELHHRASSGWPTRRTSRPPRHEREISTVAAVALLGVYLAWVVPYVRGEAAPRADARDAPRACALRGLGRRCWPPAAWAPPSSRTGSSPPCARRSTSSASRRPSPGSWSSPSRATRSRTWPGIVLARKGQADLAISVVKNSVAQVAAFLYPALVLISLLFAHQLTFALAPVLIAALLLTALVGLADHRRRRGGRLRGLGARRHLRDPGRVHALRVMGRRARIVVLVVLGAVVVLVAGGYAVLALTGDDAPPPPRLQGTPAPDGSATEGAGRWHPVAAPRAASSAIASTRSTSGSACAPPSGARAR